ncbi:GAL4-like Zn(II)2Cys6 (or C6 zinc) binuclear cluster DNA-binding domain [Teratosphaeria destructans]|uniref:GAL4-like Zn(II)2Cys6 (Or C6 zinc) binuclear cluster DNA-binding domain n=1 Tax=Teratosphaeria destructans TaxID=418781 RepID=A0A9W7SW21_9PEZI|nr:GAL4-like Zn(II)2Cys6 (or C6 zinc) binuclear cluster DNA-binding domain [Teratosphaeria destructans]
MATLATTETPPHRACAHCRSQKIRCLPDEANPDKCQRCTKSGRECVFPPPQKRKQRKRTDARVAELEREMKALRSMLRGRHDGAKTPSKGEVQPPGHPDTLIHTDDFAGSSVQGNSSARVSIIEPTGRTVTQPPTGPSHHPDRTPPWPRRSADAPREGCGDVVDRGVLSMATARQLFEIYEKDLFAHYPMVPISASTTADEFRAAKPVLFLAIIAAAAGKDDPDLSANLDKEVLQAYATRSLLCSEKSLEIVQALLISSVWYHPPSKFGQLKYYEYIHMAATMAMDIGIGTRPQQHRSRLGNANRGREPAKGAMSAQIHPIEDTGNPDLSMAPRSGGSSPDTGSIESRRTFLACYAVCAGVSLSLRRPNMLRVSSYIRECVEHLERAHDALPSDRTVVAWVKLIMIAEEISTAFCFDDPGGLARITELRTQIMIQDFEKRLTAWFTSTPAEDINPSGIIMYYSIRLYLYEVALHVDHSPDDFRAPYQMGAITPNLQCGEIPTKVLSEAIAECINCSHGLLETFLAIDIDSCRAMPVFSYVRVSFAAFVLSKLCLSAGHPASMISRMLDTSSLQVDAYLDRAVLHVRNIVGTHRARVPAIFLALLFKLRQWCLDPAVLEATAEEKSCQKDLEDHVGSTKGSKAQTPYIVSSRFAEQSSSGENSPRNGTTGLAMNVESDPNKTSIGTRTAEVSSMLTEKYEDPISSMQNGHTFATSDGSITIPQSVEDTFDYDELQQMEADYGFLSTFGNELDGGLGDWTGGDLANDITGVAQPWSGRQTVLNGQNDMMPLGHGTQWWPAPYLSGGATGYS